MTAAPLPNSDAYSISKLAKAAKGNGKKKRVTKTKGIFYFKEDSDM